MIVGIDPAYAKPHAISIFEKGRFIHAWKSTVLSEILYNLEGSEMVYIEDQFFGRNPEVLKNLAQSTGKILGLLEYSDIPYTLVRPVIWQSKVNLPKKPRKTKENPDIIVPSAYRWEKMHIQHIIDKANDVVHNLGPIITDEDIAAAVLIGYSMGVMNNEEV